MKRDYLPIGKDDDDVAPYVDPVAKQIAWVDAVRELLGESGRTYAEFRRAVDKVTYERIIDEHNAACQAREGT